MRLCRVPSIISSSYIIVPIIYNPKTAAIPMAMAPNSTAIPAAAFWVCWGAPDLVAVGAPLAMEPEGVEPEGMTPEAMGEEPEAVAVAEGIPERVTPACSQSLTRAGWRLASSSGEHLVGTHFMSAAVRGSRPVVHWHLTSVTAQPDAGRASVKQGTAHEGTALRPALAFWALTRAAEAATARTEAWKRIFGGLGTNGLFGVVGRDRVGRAKAKKDGM